MLPTVEGLVSNALAGRQLYCKQSQFQIVDPPAGEQCVNWLQSYTQSYGGYAQVLDDGNCGICPYSSGDQYLAQLNMSASRLPRAIARILSAADLLLSAARLQASVTAGVTSASCLPTLPSTSPRASSASTCTRLWTGPSKSRADGQSVPEHGC